MVVDRVYMKKIIRNGIVQSILWVLIALLFLMFYPLAPTVMAVVSGVFLLMQGVPLLYLFILEDERFIWSITFLFNCILICFLGVWLVSKPNAVHQYSSFAFSIVILLHGIEDTLLSIRLKQLLSKSWLIAIGISGIKIIMAMILLTQLHFHIQSIFIITGFCMLLDGVSDMRLWMLLGKRTNERIES